MKIALHLDDGRVLPATLPFDGAERVVVADPCACGSIAIAGGEITRGHDTYTSPAFCVPCGDMRGRLVVTVSTIFGIEEDERVMNGRCRVY